MSDQYVAEIRAVAFNFAPKGWATCDGQLLPLSQNTALFSLLGTMYGGDGKSTFALPDLRGSAPLGFGSSPGTSEYFQGQSGGQDTVVLTETEMAPHQHQVTGDQDDGASPDPTGRLPANGTAMYLPTSDTNTLSPSAISTVGGGAQHNNLQPYLVVNYIIALQGIFPPRS